MGPGFHVVHISFESKYLPSTSFRRKVDGPHYRSPEACQVGHSITRTAMRQISWNRIGSEGLLSAVGKDDTRVRFVDSEIELQAY